MVEQPTPPEPTAPTRPNPWPKAITWLGIIGMLTFAALYVFHSCMQAPREVISATGSALKDLASAFRKGTVTTSFISYATTISNHTYLQFATLKQMEIFRQSTAPSTAFGYLPLPEVVVEARAPVEYTYYLDLNARWRFELRDGVVFVFAPPVRFNKPAVDASAIVYEVRKGRFKTAEVQEQLKASITGMVIARAKDNLPLVRETGRKQTAEFVEKWLVKSFADATNYQVKVFFPDENPSEVKTRPVKIE